MSDTTMRTIICGLFFLTCFVAQASDYPNTRADDTINSYHGVRVEDPYQWLEDWSSPEVKEWSAAQNGVARELLDSLPNRDAISSRLTASLSDADYYYSVERTGEVAWFMKDSAPKPQPFIVRIDASGDPASERVIFDPEVFDESGNTSIEWFRVSPDGKKVAIALTTGGSEIADLYLIDSLTGKQIDEIVPRVNAPTAGGDLCWGADASGFYYTRYPRPGERPAEDLNFYQQIWYRKLGTPLSDDRYETGKTFDKIAEIRIEQQDGGGKLLATVQHGDGGQFDFYVRDIDSTWYQVAKREDKYVQATFIDHDNLLVLSRNNAPNGQFMRMSIGDLPRVEATALAPESDMPLVSDFYSDPPFIVHESRIYARTMLGGPEELRVYDINGKRLRSPQLGVVGLGQLVPWGDGLLVRRYSYLNPNAWILIDDEEWTRHPLSTTSPITFDGYTVEREFAVSKDGTHVPVNIIMAEDTERDGGNKVLLTGYGGYGYSMIPGFDPTRIAWLEQGGILAIANLRGGGEFGEEWHRQGMLTNKQNVFDDFHAVTRHLIDTGYTSEEGLAIEGASNGGLLIGAMLTQHTSGFRAAVAHVGIFDMLRFELSPNGAFNVPELGTVTNREQFEALYAYSPYHRIRKSDFPMTLLLTGENDGRVDPMHSRKMTAKLQANNSSDNLILLRTSGTTGHGFGTSLDELIFIETDRLAFLFNVLDMDYQPIP